jgi:hypothetical protein
LQSSFDPFTQDGVVYPYRHIDRDLSAVTVVSVSQSGSLRDTVECLGNILLYKLMTPKEEHNAAH